MDIFLKNYLNGFSPSGFETKCGGQKIWLDEMKKYAKHTEMDAYGNAYAYFGDLGANYTVLIDAHADEIGYVVSDIRDDGLLKIDRLGGSDIFITPASRVTIFDKN